MFLLLPDRKMCLVLSKDEKMFLLLLDRRSDWSCWRMGRCSCFQLVDGKMFLLLLNRNMRRVLLEDGKMCLVQLEDGKMCRVLLEEGKMFLLLMEGGKMCQV